MLSEALFVLATVGLFGSLFFGRLLWKSEVESVRYRLFDLRDRLVLLVAEGTLEKDSAIFAYYYNAINGVLKLTEKMHLEGLLQAWQAGKLSREQLEAHRIEMQELAKTLAKSPQSVVQVVSDYYDTMRDMLLVNSNFFSVAYLLSRKQIGDGFAKWLERQEPKVAKTYRDIEAERQQLGVSQKLCSSTV